VTGLRALLVVLQRAWPALLATAVFLPHALAFDFLTDDGYISFRYAWNLAEHGELVFNLGERVEGYTNFLWTVLLAAGIKLGVSPAISSRFLGVMFAVGSLAVVGRLSRRLDGERSSPWHAVAPLGLAATGAFACWATGGLETQMFTFLALLGWERLLAEVDRGRGVSSAFYFALAAMTRPEGLLLFGLAGLFRLGLALVRDRRLPVRRHELAWAGLFVLVFAPYFLWRWRYYGWAFPNTFYVKSSGGAGTTALGLQYLRRFAEDHGAFFLIPLALLGWPRRGDSRRQALFALSALVVVAFALYVVKVGGDFMGLYRFVLPVLPLGALCVQEALRTLAARLRPVVPWPVLGLAGLAIAGGYGLASYKVSRTAADNSPPEPFPVDSPGYLKQYVDERVAIGLWFRAHARPDDLATFGGAGVIPYYSRIPGFDCYGLVDETIAHDPAMTSSNRPGHQKWVADWYIAKRRPTLLTHSYQLNGVTPPHDFRALGYEWVTARIPGMPAPGLYSFWKRVDRAFGPFPPHATSSP
jgi:hypothetical protein